MKNYNQRIKKKNNSLKTNLLKTDLLKTDLLKTDLLKTDLLKTDSLKTDSLKTDLLKTDLLKTTINNQQNSEEDNSYFMLKNFILEVKRELRNKNIVTNDEINNLLDDKFNMFFFDDINEEDNELIYIYKLLNEIKNKKEKLDIDPKEELDIYPKEELDIDPKEEFRQICESCIDFIKYIDLPEIKKGQKNEAVLIEYRCFPHLEFLIRNAILKLGSKWSFSVVCGKLNYEFISNLCLKISPEIKIIKTDYENLNQSTYSLFLASVDFWNLFSGEKILIYQEDSCIFNSNINDFLIWDYIGAPWDKTQNDTPNCVGNGGFSLRTKKCMINVINNKHINKIILNSSTMNYINSTGMKVAPEDVYFSKIMQESNIGKVADWDIASNFSTESIFNINSFGGHNFWLSDNNWKIRICTQTLKTFKLYNKFIESEHRGGWNTIIKFLHEIKFFNEYSSNIFLDIIERHFIWENRGPIFNLWSGFIHCTPFTPPYLNKIDISLLFKNQSFIISLDNCYCLFTLSTYITNYLNNEIKKINKNVKIFTLKHPTDLNDILYFDIENYIKNTNKKLIQIGQQMRKVTSIYLLKVESHEKIWLTGTRNIKRCNFLFNNECSYLNLNVENKNVRMYYTNTPQEYDELLSKNIVFVDFFDTAANNTIIECIARNTPIICKKLEGAIEYLGPNYPLYFNNLDEVYELLNITKIREGFEYLKNMNKKDIEIDYFVKELINITNLRI